MADLTFIDRLTLKRNGILEKRLQVRLQIIGDEYRLTRKDIEQHSRDLADFLVYVRHTVPGASAYSQPDSRSLRSQFVKIKRRCQSGHIDGNKIPYNQKTYSKKINNGKCQCCDSTGMKNSNEEKINKEINSSLNVSSSKVQNSRGIEKRKLQRMNTSSFVSDTENNEHINGRLDFANKKDELSGYDTSRSFSSLELPSRRAQTAKYGRSACTQQDEMLRKTIFNRFENIFSLQEERKADTMSDKVLTSSTFGRCNKSVLDPTAIVIPCEQRYETSYFKPITSFRAQIMTRRLTQSAYQRVSENLIQETQGAYRRISNNIKQEANTSIPNHGLSVSYSHIDRTSDFLNSTETHKSQQTTESAASLTSLNEPAADANVMETQVDQQTRTASRRPRTAPPNYELKQKSVPAPRQQVAGFHAEAHSRRADTLAIVKKSRQIQDMVKTLAPTEKCDDDSVSD